jgi:GNAT superfamily N-acetyltransferase
MQPARIELAPFMDQETRQFIMNGVDHHNIAGTGEAESFPVNLVLRGEDGDVLGGLLGEVWGKWLKITYLWVAEVARGKGLATAMLNQAEDYARARGVRWATLETHSFQARPLYEQQGYKVFGTLDDYPPGHKNFYMKKTLA